MIAPLVGKVYDACYISNYTVGVEIGMENGLGLGLFVFLVRVKPMDFKILLVPLLPLPVE